MFAIGCIQAQFCHTNKCPVGIATQDPRRMAALDVRAHPELQSWLERWGRASAASFLPAPMPKGKFAA